MIGIEMKDKEQSLDNFYQMTHSWLTTVLVAITENRYNDAIDHCQKCIENIERLKKKCKNPKAI